MPDIRLNFDQSVRARSGNWYRVLQQLGQGRNADAYLVLCTSGELAGVPLALKLFRRITSPQSAERFLDETRFLQSCGHPAIMRSFDNGVYLRDFPFVVVEYLPMTLRQAMPRLSTVEKVACVLQLLSALTYLSRLTPSVIHCDLKPDNVFVKSNSCVLGDFGLARPETGNVLGSDEQIPPTPHRHRTPDYVDFANRVSPLTCKSDIFQLGLIAAELFTGVNPQRETSDRLSQVELDSLGRIPGVHGTLITTMIYRMLAIKADDRPTTSELLDYWRTPFSEVAKLAHAMDERVFY
jgi:serine/threonine protein kinase